MPAAGDDLRKYLIAPHSFPSSSNPQSNQISPDPSLRSDTPRIHKSADRKAENSNMDIDYLTKTATQASGHAGNAGVSVPFHGVMSLDDFLITHQGENGASVKGHETVKGPPTRKSKPSKDSTPPQPIAVGARSSKYTILLHEKYQALAIPQPVFTFEGDSVTRWAVTVSFPGLDDAEELQGLKEEGRFNSKQEAKEAASKSALTILERLVEEGRVTAVGKTKKPKGQPAIHQPKDKENPGENFVGQILEFQRATSSPQPLYTDYQFGTRWACLMEIEGHDKPFSSLDAVFGSKKAARQHAAGCAVAHFKAQNLWPSDYTDLGGIKKRKLNNGNNTNEASTSTSSAMSQVATLAHQLGLSTPEYRFINENSAVIDLHTVTCVFKNGGPHEGPIGEVRNVFGKKKAKEECARLTLEYLTEVKRQRHAVFAKLIAGGSMGAEMAIDRKEGIPEVLEKEAGSDDDLDIYEDAVDY